MKPNKRQQTQQRQLLDQRNQNLPTWSPVPKTGWLKSVRNSLGLTTRQLAELMKTNPSGISKLEINEIKKTASLKSLATAAAAMDCELVYAIVPKSPNRTLDEILDQKALLLAQKISKGVAHSMSLEEQSVSKEVTNTQIKNLAQELKRNLDPRLWKRSKK